MVITDRAVVLLKASAFSPTNPKELVARLPKSGPVGPPVGKVFGKLMLNDERHWVHRRFFKDIEAANAA